MRKRGTGCLFLFPLRHEVEGDGGQDDEALDRLLPVGGNAHHGHTVIEDANDEAADQRAADRTGAAGDGRAADEAGRDGIKLKVDTGLGCCRVEAGSVDQRGHSAHEAHVGIGQEEVQPVLDAGEHGRLAVTADGVQAALSLLCNLT